MPFSLTRSEATLIAVWLVLGAYWIYRLLSPHEHRGDDVWGLSAAALGLVTAIFGVLAQLVQHSKRLRNENTRET